MNTPDFSNFDVFATAKELDLMLSGSNIVNLYEVDELLLIKVNTDQGKKNLLIKKDSRLNLTDYEYEIPKFPSQYIISLRKHLKNKRILKVYQYNFDRIVIFELYNPETDPWKLIIELFNKGNYILLNETNNVIVAKSYKKYKDRDILPNKVYTFPQSRGIDFLSINQEEQFSAMFKNNEVEIVKVLARNISISGLYSEEICFRSKIDKNTIANTLNEPDIHNLFIKLKDLRNELLFGEIHAHIVYNSLNQEIAAFPFEIEQFKANQKKYFSTFNEAIDEFCSKVDLETSEAKDDKISSKIKAQEKILKNQMEYLEHLKVKKSKYYDIGNYIYSNFSAFEKLMDTIVKAKLKGYKWEEINEKLVLAKREGLEGTENFDRINPASKDLNLKINNIDVNFNLNLSVGENASLIFAKGKKTDQKIKGTITAIETTKQQIEDLCKEKQLKEEGAKFLVKKPKKKWYEKFHWFISSDGFLIIGGRDATSNENVFKKYLEPNDLVLHTDMPGSPLTVIKNFENQEIPETTINEAGDFVASYSHAWKENWGFVDVFYVKSDQVSKSPPTGEYLPKGSFMIFGKKNFVKGAKTELAIGLDLTDLSETPEEEKKIYYPKLICGPKSAIQKQFKNSVIFLLPSRNGLPKGDLAKEVKTYFMRNLPKDMNKWVNLLSIDEILLILPDGLSIIKQ